MVAYNAPKKKTCVQVPILSAVFVSKHKMLFAYGHLPNISIEKIKLDFSEECITLFRDNIYTTQENKNEAATKLKRTLNDEAQYISLSKYIWIAYPRTNFNYPIIEFLDSSKRHPKEDPELALQEKLEHLSVDIEEGSAQKKSSKGDNMVQLLLQALHSKDKELLGTVLNVKKETIIYNTVSKLPIQAIDPFLRELTPMIQGKTHA